AGLPRGKFPLQRLRSLIECPLIRETAAQQVGLVRGMEEVSALSLETGMGMKRNPAFSRRVRLHPLDLDRQPRTQPCRRTRQRGPESAQRVTRALVFEDDHGFRKVAVVPRRLSGEAELIGTYAQRCAQLRTEPFAGKFQSAMAFVVLNSQVKFTAVG